MKKDIHGKYYEGVEVQCICGANFKINATVAGPIKVETCYKCHPTYNKDLVVKKVIKGRLEKFYEKQKRIDTAKEETTTPAKKTKAAPKAKKAAA